MYSVVVFFLAIHPVGGEHMADFANSLDSQSISYSLVATESAYNLAAKKNRNVENFYQGHIPLKDLGEQELNELAMTVAERINLSAVKVIADVGSHFSALVFKELNRINSKTVKIAYYDNPESFVPGAYSESAAHVIRSADQVLFANAALKGTTIYNGNKQALDLSSKVTYGLGYFPFSRVEFLKELRSEEVQVVKRKDFFEKAGLEDTGQRLLVYIGGANTVYEELAFPAFANILSEAASSGSLDNTIVVLQRHPRASQADREVFESLNNLYDQKTQFVVSDVDFDSAIAIADTACYYQTSASSFFPLIDLPAFQIGHEQFDDILIRNDLCPFVGTATELDNFLNTSDNRFSINDLKQVYEILGADPEWKDHLRHIVKN